MSKPRKKSDVIQTSITMERHLKERYSKLAFKMDLSFSQLVRLGLRHVEDGVAKDISLHPELLDKLKNSLKL